MNQVAQFIEEYAHLEHKAAIYKAHGHPIPADISLRMEGIAAWGRANIRPDHFASAIRQKDGRLAQLHMQRGAIEAKKNAGTNRQLLNTAAGKLTKGMLGQDRMTANQLAAIVNKQPLRARITNKRPTQAEIDAQIRAVTRQFDPKGVGWGAKEYMRRMDELTDATPEEFAKLCFKYRADPSATRRECAQWKTKRVEFALKQRQIDRDETRGKTENPMLNKDGRNVSDPEHRKATLATAMLADSVDQSERGDPGSFNGLSERNDIHRSYLEDTGRRGEMARAFAKVESIGYDG